MATNRYQMRSDVKCDILHCGKNYLRKICKRFIGSQWKLLIVSTIIRNAAQYNTVNYCKNYL